MPYVVVDRVEIEDIKRQAQFWHPHSLSYKAALNLENLDDFVSLKHGEVYLVPSSIWDLILAGLEKVKNTLTAADQLRRLANLFGYDQIWQDPRLDGSGLWFAERRTDDDRIEVAILESLVEEALTKLSKARRKANRPANLGRLGSVAPESKKITL